MIITQKQIINHPVPLHGTPPAKAGGELGKFTELTPPWGGWGVKNIRVLTLLGVRGHQQPQNLPHPVRIIEQHSQVAIAVVAILHKTERREKIS